MTQEYNVEVQSDFLEWQTKAQPVAAAELIWNALDADSLPAPQPMILAKEAITAFERSPDGGKGLARDTRVRWALEEVAPPRLRSHCPVGDARLNKVLGCFGPRVETDLPEHFAVLLGVHVVVPKGAISSKKVGCDGLDRCGQFVEQCSRLQVSTVLWVLGSFGAPPVGGLLKVQSQRLPYFVIGHFVPFGQVDWIASIVECQILSLA
jgi:hypothetical protein